MRRILFLNVSICSSLEGLNLSFVMLQFNRKPVKGVEFLTSNKLVENSPTAVAQFLRTTNNLDKV